MSEHMHTGAHHLFVTFLGVWIIWNALRAVAAFLAAKSGFVGNVGAAMGGTL